MVTHPNSESPPPYPLLATPRKTTTGVIFVAQLSLTRFFYCMGLSQKLRAFCRLLLYYVWTFEITITSGALIATADEIL